MQMGRWIGERLEGYVKVSEAGELTDPTNMDVVLLGSGVYSHTVLPPLKQYVMKYRDMLAGKQTAVFGVAIDTSGVFVRGKLHGGWDYIMPLINMLVKPPIHAGLLGGEINPFRLNEKDRQGLTKFYEMMGRGEEIPFKTKMTKQAAWEFAEKLMQRLAGEKIK